MQTRRKMHTAAASRLCPRADGSWRYTRTAMAGRKEAVDRRPAVLFLCRHNAVRSQLAEALLRARFPDRYDAASAGICPAGVHPLVLRVLEEAGVSSEGLRSKHVGELSGRSFEIVATVCGQDEPTCPFFPGGRQIHHPFADPSVGVRTEEDRLAAFRSVRDEIDAWLVGTFGAPVGEGPGPEPRLG